MVVLSRVHSVPPAPVLSEINLFPGVIEVANPGDTPLDLSEWELQAWSGQFFANAGNVWIRIPAGSVLAARDVFTWSPFASELSSFPNLTGGSSSAGSLGSLYQDVLFRLLDSSGRTVDQVWIRPGSGLLAGMDISGPRLPSPYQGGSWLRHGRSNHRSPQDWVTGPPTLGLINPNFNLPWEAKSLLALATNEMVHGIWTGEVTISSSEQNNIVLHADDGAGLVATSQPFPFHRNPALTLAIPPSAAQANEVGAGYLGEMVISVDEPLTHPLLVHLQADASDEFEFPPLVTIPAGATSASVAISNLDDHIPDGDAFVTLTAEAPGFAPGIVTLRNRDAQFAELILLAPESLNENLGFSLYQGEVVLPFMATHAISVRLTSQWPLQVPSEIVIQRGERLADFWLRSEDDSVVNDKPYSRMLTATSGSGAPARAAISMIDNDSPSIRVIIPTVLLEGTKTNGYVELEAPHAAELEVRLYSNSPRLVVPASTIIPAGVKRWDFPISAPDDLFSNGNEQLPVSYLLPESQIQTAYITVLDDERDVALIFPNLPASSFLNSLPVTWQASTYGQYSQPRRYTGPGEISLGALAKCSVNLARPVQFTNGFWSDQVVFIGEGINVPLTIYAAGTNSSPKSIDILEGRLVAGVFLDLALVPSSSKLLALAASTSQSPAVLVELDASNGITNRVLALPQTANRIALSDDASVAWLASFTNTLQRIEVSSWKFGREISLNNVFQRAFASEVVALPGTQEGVVALVNERGTGRMRIAFFEQGSLIGNPIDFLESTSNARLFAGRNGREVFSLTSASLTRYSVGSQGVTVAIATNLSSYWLGRPNLAVVGDRLYHGDGAIFDAETLLRIRSDSFDDGLTIVNPDRGNQLFVNRKTSRLESRSLDTGLLSPGHGLPFLPVSGSKFVGWGSRGLAYISEPKSNIVIFESPLQNPVRPRLDFQVQRLDTLRLQSLLQPTNVEITCVISNGGPVEARGNAVESTLSPGKPFSVPDLLPGESWELRVPLPAFIKPGILRHRTALLSASGNSSSNSVVESVIRIYGPEHPNVRELVLGATAMSGNPSGDRLYVSIASQAGDIRDGIAIIDPETGNELGFLPTSQTPGKALTSHDGTKLYAAIGANGLMRWSLETGSNEVSITITNDQILDFQPVAENPTLVVVATTKRLFLYSDGDQLSQSISAAANDSRLAYSGTNLWSYTPNTLRRLSVNSKGLSAAYSGSTVPPSFGYRFFVGDGTYLFASGPPLNTETMTIANQYPQANWLVVDQPSGNLLGYANSYDLRRFDRNNFSTIESQTVPGGLGFWSLVLWGADGIATLGDQVVVLTRSPLRHHGEAADLALEIKPPENPIASEPGIWQLCVTNRSGSASGPVQIAVRTPSLPARSIQFEGIEMVVVEEQFVGRIPSVAAHSTVCVRMNTVIPLGGTRVEASIVSTSPDPTLADHVAVSDIEAFYPVGDLALSVISPTTPIRLNIPFRLGCLISNAGPTRLQQTSVYVSEGGNALQLTPSPCEDCEVQQSGGFIVARNRSLSPGESYTVWFDASIRLPGIFGVRAVLGGQLIDSVSENNEKWFSLISADSIAPGTVASLAYTGVRAAGWCRPRDQLVVLPKTESALWLVDPDTLVPTNRVLLPAPPTHLSVSDDGLHVWLLLQIRRAVRVNLQTLRIDADFDFSSYDGPARAVASVPGNPNAVVLALLASDDSAQGVLRQFINGQAIGSAINNLPLAYERTDLLFLKDGRLVAGTPQALRLYSVRPEGIELQTDLDPTIESWSFTEGMTEVDGALLVGNGTLLRPDPLQVDHTLDAPYGVYVFDESQGLLHWCRLFGGANSDGNLLIDSFDSGSLALRSQSRFSSPDLGATPQTSRVVAMGRHGLLFLSDPGLLFRSASTGRPAVALGGGFQSAGILELSPEDLELKLSVTNYSEWLVQTGSILVQLPPGMTFSPDGPGAGKSELRLELGLMSGVTNLTFNVRSETAGEARITANIHSEPPDVTGDPVTLATTVQVLPRPMLVLPDLRVPEGSSFQPRPPFVRLSRRTAYPVEVDYTVSFLSADASDVVARSGKLLFPPGQTLAALSLVLPDNISEQDETLMLHLSSTTANLLKPEVLLTVVDDDMPAISTRPISVVEGNGSIANAEVRLTLSQPSSRALQVGYKTEDLTAVAGQDYLARAGWVQFAPGETSAVVQIPIVGDARIEPNEAFKVLILDASNAFVVTNDETTITILNDDLRPLITAMSRDQSDLKLSFQTLPSTSYQVQFATEAGSIEWTTLPGFILGTGDIVTTSVPLSNSERRFFRIVSQ